MEGELDPSTGKQLEGLEKEQMIGMPLLEVARGQAELEADNVQKMMQALGRAVPREKKRSRKSIRLLFYLTPASGPGPRDGAAALPARCNTGAGPDTFWATPPPPF